MALQPAPQQTYYPPQPASAAPEVEANASVPGPQRFAQPMIPARPRALWPWPMFILGAASLVAVWLGRPYWRPTDGERVRRDMAEARSLLSRGSADLTRTEALARKVLDNGIRYPQFVGEANFVLGCVHLKRAEDGGDPEAEYRLAREYLEQAVAAGVPEADQVRLTFCLGKALHLTKAEPNKALEYLKKGDDPELAAERWQYIAEAYMQLREPSLKEAINATNNQIANLTPADARARAGAYYRLADLNLRHGQTARAREALEQVRPGDAPELYDAARVLLARCHQAEHNYVLATAAWEQVRSKAKPPIDKGVIGVELGYCYWKAGRIGDAKRIWDEVQAYGGETAQAAMLRKAEVQLADPANRAAAVPMIEDALRSVHQPVDYRNPMYPAEQLRQLLEKSCHEFKASGDWAPAGKLAELLTRVSGAVKGKELASEIALAWGVSLQREAQVKSGQEKIHLTEESCKQFRTAAALASGLATTDRPVNEQVEWLRRAAKYYLKCNDKIDIQNAVEVLDRIQKISKGGPVDGEVAFLKAVALHNLGDIDQAIESYRACIGPNHPQAGRARYEMVVLLLAKPAATREEEQIRLNQAAEELAPNLDLKLQESDAEAAEMSAYLMGYIHFNRRDWAKAEEHLSAAIRKFPKSVESVQARFRQGRCHWFQAGKDSQAAGDDKLPPADREQARLRKNAFLAKALLQFEPLEEELFKLEQEQQLSDTDRVYYRDTSFAAAECYFHMEDYPEAVRRYELLRLRYKGQIEEMIALAQLWLCYNVYLDKPEKGQAMLGVMRELLKSLKDDAFDGSSNVHKRDFWEDWLRRAAPGGGDLKPPAEKLPELKPPM